MAYLIPAHGRLAGFDNQYRWGSQAGFVTGGEGKSPVVIPGSDGSIARFEDFEGSAQAFSTTPIEGWLSRKGSDGGCVDWTRTEAVNGTLIGTLGKTTATMAVSGIQLSRGLNWKANQGGVALQARLQMSRITNMAVYFGFTDQVSALEMPINSAASVDTITTTCTDGCGFLYDTAMTTQQWWTVGVANDVDAAKTAIGVAPAVATYDILRVELDKLGNATFYRNNVRVGSMAAAVTPTIPLTLVLAAFNRETAADPTITLDWLSISGNRV